MSALCVRKSTNRLNSPRVWQAGKTQNTIERTQIDIAEAEIEKTNI